MFVDIFVSNTLIAVIFLFVIIALDRYEKESLTFVVLVFFITILLTFLFGKVKFMIIGEREFSLFIRAFIEAGFFEELFKYSVLVFVLYVYKKDVDEIFDIIVYAVIVASGFSIAENFNYFFLAGQRGIELAAKTGKTNLYSKQMLEMFLGRVLPVHSLIMLSGLFFLNKRVLKISKIKAKDFFTPFVFSVMFHGVWDYLAMRGQVNVLLPYIFSLTMISSFTVFEFMEATEFKLKRIEAERLVDIYFFVISKINLSGNSRIGQIRDVLGSVKSMLKKIYVARGEEQNQFYEHFKEKAKIVEEEFSKALPDLDRIYSNLKQVENHLSNLVNKTSIDWGYYIGFFILIYLAVGLAYYIHVFLF